MGLSKENTMAVAGTGKEGRFVQLRPGTSQRRRHIRVWDNTNLAESYAGIVLPLTMSFAKDLYTNVYADVARHSGVSESRILRLEHVFSNLIGFHKGRMFYNLFNWYRMLALFPGYARNKRNLDEMIGVKERVELENSLNKGESMPFSAYYYILLMARLIAFESKAKEFTSKVNQYLSWASSQDFAAMDLDELLHVYYSFKRELLGRWSHTVDNDFLAMTTYGFLRTLCRKYRLDESFLQQMITGLGRVASAQQVKDMRLIAQEVAASPKLQAIILEGKANVAASDIENLPEYSLLLRNIRKYLQEYRGRFGNDLKLEAHNAITLPEFLKLCTLYTQNQKATTINGPQNNGLSRELRRLPAHARLAFLAVVPSAKKYLRRREAYRLLRSQAFSYCRDIFAAMGKGLYEEQAIVTPEDIQYLELHDIIGYVEGASPVPELKGLVAMRKKAYQKYQKERVPDRFSTEAREPLCQHPAPEEKKESGLRGEGCSGGKIRGKVTVLDSYALPAGSNTFDIIVTRHTDPGWTPLFGLCRGIIVERGGMLSHAAIVARELNLPCVIGVAGATEALKDGQVITMDGKTGEIRIES
ncbi:TPA: hypothetical protein HA361_00100 [Candidatus Woesearchaeota archaeon]|nr:hypothetical protein [Candidatus Woesearchaeota archaeon]